MKAWIMLVVILVAALLVGSTQASRVEPKVRFDGHQVLRFVIENEEQAKTLLEFVRENRLDVWSHRLQIGQPFDVNVAPKHLDAIQGLGIRSSVFIPDLQAAIDEEARLQEEAVATGKTGITAELMAGTDDSWFKAYQQFTDIQTFVQNLAGNYSSFVQYIEIGTTIEGRPIFGVTISTGASSTGGAKPGYFFNGCQHAREWISPMTVTYIMWSLVTGYQQDPNITALVEAFDWTIVPIVNGDGYVYTQTNRMWRKNRRENGGILRCVGVDNNRNWNNHWDQGGASKDPCSDEYCGSGPFSEPEETAVANWIGNATNVQVYIDFHSYSQLWMTPWGWTDTLPNDYQTQLDGANIAVKALSELYGTQYTTGNIYATIYEATGSSTDWVYNAGVKWSYAVELRDQGQYGFTLPPSEILPSGKETLAGVLALGQYVQQQLAL